MVQFLLEFIVTQKSGICVDLVGLLLAILSISEKSDNGQVCVCAIFGYDNECLHAMRTRWWVWPQNETILTMEVHYNVYVVCLQTAGHTLMQKYNKQFKKLLFVLCKEYVHQ